MLGLLELKLTGVIDRNLEKEAGAFQHLAGSSQPEGALVLRREPGGYLDPTVY